MAERFAVIYLARMDWKRYLEDPALGDFVAYEAQEVRVLVRRGYEEVIGTLGLDGTPVETTERVAGGRQPHPLVTLAGGERIVVRAYRRGGALRHLNRDRYFLGHRAFAELRATERARAAGVCVPAVVAAAERRERFGYTAALGTRWIAATELHHWLLAHPHDQKATLRTAGREVAAMHAAGIAHPDLNLRNFLAANGAPDVYVLDFDRARLYAGPVPARRRARDLLRLARSARKLRSPIDPSGWEALRAGYGDGWPLPAPLG